MNNYERIRPLSEKELWEALYNDSDEDVTREMDNVDAFSDISEEVKDNIVENMGNIPSGEYEAETEPIFDDDSLESSSESNDENVDTSADRYGHVWSRIALKRGKTRPADILRSRKVLTSKSKDVTSIAECFKIFIFGEMIEMIVKFTNQKLSHISKNTMKNMRTLWNLGRTSMLLKSTLFSACTNSEFHRNVR